MKRKTLVITAAVLGVTAIAAGATMAHAKCKGMYGGYMAGPCMQGGAMYGPGMSGPGMYGHGMKRGFGPSGCQGGPQALAKPVTVDDVRANLEQRLKWRGNDRLKVGEVKELNDKTIVAEIVTVDDSLVRKIEIDKTTGRRLRPQTPQRAQ